MKNFHVSSPLLVPADTFLPCPCSWAGSDGSNPDRNSNFYLILIQFYFQLGHHVPQWLRETHLSWVLVSSSVEWRESEPIAIYCFTDTYFWSMYSVWDSQIRSLPLQSLPFSEGSRYETYDHRSKNKINRVGVKKTINQTHCGTVVDTTRLWVGT